MAKDYRTVHAVYNNAGEEVGLYRRFASAQREAIKRTQQLQGASHWVALPGKPRAEALFDTAKESN